jgi:hypothetical protein
MNKYYNDNGYLYFEEPATATRETGNYDIKKQICTFEKKISDSRYSVKRPSVKILGHVNKQD